MAGETGLLPVLSAHLSDTRDPEGAWTEAWEAMRVARPPGTRILQASCSQLLTGGSPA